MPVGEPADEVANIPPDVPAAWAEAGPVRSQRDIAGHLAAMAGRDLLKIDDADVAADHFTLLTFTNVAGRSYFEAIPSLRRVASRHAHRRQEGATRLVPDL